MHVEEAERPAMERMFEPVNHSSAQTLTTAVGLGGLHTLLFLFFFKKIKQVKASSVKTTVHVGRAGRLQPSVSECAEMKTGSFSRDEKIIQGGKEDNNLQTPSVSALARIISGTIRQAKALQRCCQGDADAASNRGQKQLQTQLQLQLR